MDDLDKKVKKIHKESIILDCHYDLPMHIAKKRNKGERKVIERDYLPDMKKGGVNVVVLAIFVEEEYLPEMALRKGLEQVSVVYQDIEESCDKLSFCKNYDDIIDALKSDKLAILLSFEGLEPIQKDLNMVKIFKELGVNICGISWSRRNFAADGCGFDSEDGWKRSGLTDFGIEAVKYADEMGMIIDVTHLSEEAFWDVLKYVDGPIIASHTNCQGVNNIKRNFTDEQIRAIAKRNGVIGMNGVSAIAVPHDKANNVETLVDHIDYIKNLVGIDHVGLGLDMFDFLQPVSGQLISNINGKDKVITDIILGYENLESLTKSLLKREYSEEEISKILGGNFMRVLKEKLK